MKAIWTLHRIVRRLEASRGDNCFALLQREWVGFEIFVIVLFQDCQHSLVTDAKEAVQELVYPNMLHSGELVEFFLNLLSLLLSEKLLDFFIICTKVLHPLLYKIR